MSILKVKVKWSGKKTLEDVELNQSEKPSIFKATILALTGVPIERQKLMFRGCVIKDDNWPKNAELTDGCMFMLIGSGDKLPEAPQEKPTFVEDMTEDEKAVALDLPAGLTNLGNTCYMSATVQCLRTIPELRQALKNFDFELSILATLSSGPNTRGVVAALRDLYATMESAGTAEPMILLRMLHSTIPRFSQRGEGNSFQQQDANECWTEVTRMLQQHLQPLNEHSKYRNFVDEYFSGVLEAEMKCDETNDEEITKSEENFLQLSCFISQEVKYMQTGLVSRMRETITKFSPTLARDASYSKTTRISRLPAYLTIQFVRFHYKGNVQTNAKLLREVKFPTMLDVYDLCSKELQEKLTPMRTKYKKADDIQATRQRTGKSGPPAKRVLNSLGGQTGKPSSQDSCSDDSSPSLANTTAYERYLANDMSELKRYSFDDDPGSNNSGFYDLKAVLTHRGRSSDSGHYVAWVKKEETWYKCDDEYVENVTEEEVMKLAGGGDWHCAYVCLYGPRFLDTDEPLVQEKN